LRKKYVNENNTFAKENIEVNCIKTEKFSDSNIEAHLEISKENEITQVASTWTKWRKGFFVATLTMRLPD
jgi:hypothetical protein